MGADVGKGEEIMNVKIPRRVCLVLGSEFRGIRDVLKNQLDLVVTIPMYQSTLSLNVAQAATILCYEITKQQKI